MHEVVVLAGGATPPATRVGAWRQALRDAPPEVVVAADSGLALAAPLRLRVDRVVGDLDSVADDDLRRFERAGGHPERHPVDKDATDLALALDVALELRPERITVLGGGGGRADHELALWLLLAAPAYASVSVRAWSHRATTEVVQPGRTVALRGVPGQLCSLLPVHGPARGVATEGLRFALDDETLEPGTSRGVSNELSAQLATVTLRAGTLLAVRPHEG